MISGHSRPTLDRDLQVIRDDILRLGSLVEQSLDHAFTAFKVHDKALAQDVINDDQAINDLRYKIEHAVTATMALQQPMAHDLRVLVASLIIANELERMGDHMEGIARTVLRFSTKPAETPDQLFQMSDHAKRMLRQSMDALLEESADRAAQTAAEDDASDHLYRELFDTVVQQMCQSESSAEIGTYLLWTGHNLERFCDRVTNLCERVIYMSTGKTSRGLNPKPGDQPGTS
jgi:phosphate transport system protein